MKNVIFFENYRTPIKKERTKKMYVLNSTLILNPLLVVFLVTYVFLFLKEYILYPWRYSLRRPCNYQTLQEIGEYAARKARLPDGRLYEVTTIFYIYSAYGSYSSLDLFNFRFNNQFQGSN